MPEVSIDSCKKEVLIGYIGILYRKFKERFPNEPINFTEVKHGEWLWELADNGWADHICSKCGYTINTDIHVIVDYDYCPNSGARMDGE